MGQWYPEDHEERAWDDPAVEKEEKWMDVEYPEQYDDELEKQIDVNYMQQGLNTQNQTNFRPRRRALKPLEPDQWRLLESLRGAQGPPKLLKEIAPHLDPRLLPILANVGNSHCLKCGLEGHRRNDNCPLDDKELTSHCCTKHFYKKSMSIRNVLW